MIDIASLLATAAQLFDVSDGALRDGRGRNPRMVACRQALAYVLRRHDLSLNEIGAVLHRDHTTIIHSLRQATRRADDDPGYAAKLRALYAASIGRQQPAPPLVTEPAVRLSEMDSYNAWLTRRMFRRWGGFPFPPTA